jgi:uncharacterized protein YbjT (DUF2867 family)
MTSPNPDLLVPSGGKLLVVGATGSIGHLAVTEARRRGFSVRALVRRAGSAKRFPAGVEIVVGDVTVPDTLPAAVADVSAIVFTLGSDGQGKVGAETVDYGGVRNVLGALDGRRVRIALMTSIGVTDRDGSYNRSTEAHDWKRRSERLVRRSGLPYTIVRPGWFDYNRADERRLVLLQGDRRHSGTPNDGAVSRQQIAEMLVHVLTSAAATRKTFELVSAPGPAPVDPDVLLAALRPDAPGGLDAVDDIANMPLDDEDLLLRVDLDAVAARFHGF